MEKIFTLPINKITKILSEKFSSKIAITDLSCNRDYSYKDLYNLTLKYSIIFSKYLSKNEDLVYVNSNTVEHIFFLFSSIENNFRFVPINPRLKEKEILMMLKQINPKCLIYGPEFKGDISIIQKELKIENVFSIEEIKNMIEHIKEKEHDFPDTNSSLEDDVLILFTSGTTGIPKAARISKRMILFNVFHTVMYWELQSNDSTTIHTPMFHAGGLNVLTTPLLFIGGRLYLLEKFNTEDILILINEKKINLLFAVPTMFHMMINSQLWKDISLENMKLIISGGAPCPKIIYDEFLKKNFILKQGFGMTEVGVNCFFISNDDAKQKIGSVGKPMMFLDVTLTDEGNNIIDSEGKGVIWFKGPVVFNGYVGIPKESTFDERLGFCSGDIAYRDPDGFFWIVGRTKDVIIRGGENIYPLEIEREVYECSWVEECSLVGMQNTQWGEIPILFIKTRKKVSQNDINDLYANLRKSLSSYKLPHTIVLINEFPKNSMGKIQKKGLLEKLNKGEFIGVFHFK